MKTKKENLTKEIIKGLRKKGFIVEEQPKFKITIEDDEEFLMMYDDIFKFCEDIKGN